MAQRFVTVQLAPIFRNFRGRIESLRDDIIETGGRILRQEEEQSIRLRWYDRGRTLGSLKEEIVTEGEAKIYRLFPTATNRGFSYPAAGEYGTGRLGAATGKPAPIGWRYGSRRGMTARRFSRIAVAQAKPKVVADAQQLIANFTIN